MGKIIGYTRVSSVDQNLDRQLKDMEVDKVFEDKCSGKDTKRPMLAAMLDYVREGDTIVVHDISRLARNIKDLLELVDTITSQGVSIKFIKENLHFGLDTDNAMDKLLLNLLGSVYEFERSMLRERQLEGIAIAKDKGKYKGRPTTLPVDAIKESIVKGASCKAVTELYGISRAYFYKLKNSLNP